MINFATYIEIMEQIVEFLLSWGYAGMFAAAFVAGSLIPFASEVVFVGFVAAGLNPWGCLAAASVGNMLGGMTCYWIGSAGKTEWIGKYLKIGPEKMDKASRFVRKRGAAMGFFAFLPYIGGAIAVLLGLMRSNPWGTAAAMLLGKTLRYGVLLWAALGAGATLA